MSSSRTESTSSQAARVSVQPCGPVRGSIRPPGSKSLTNRALVCAAMARDASVLRGALRSEDTEVMIDSLAKCGVAIEVLDGGRELRVDGRHRAPSGEPVRELFIANSGTTIRFLTAALSAAGGTYRLHGVPRMHQRPIADLVAALQPVQRGRITTESGGGCPPVEIDSQGWSDSPIRVGGSVSSQYLSGLMMAAPIALSQRSGEPETPRSVAIEVVGELVSRPYVDMTAAVMRSFGAGVTIEDSLPPESEVSTRVRITGDGYRGTDYAIEPDASAASYFWAAAAITGGRVTVEGLQPDALQGDVGFCRVLEQMGCSFEADRGGMTVSGGPLHGIDVDMNAVSDTVQTLAVVALFAAGPTRVRGVAHNRFKETDRIGDLACELRKLGAGVDEHQDGLTIHPPAEGLRPATLETYQDHRMAMSLSLAGLASEGVTVLNPACTSKTYPEFFADLERLIGRAHRWR